MDYIISDIVNALYDDDTFYTIIKTNYEKGFILVKQLNSNKEFKITIKEQKEN